MIDDVLAKVRSAVISVGSLVVVPTVNMIIHTPSFLPLYLFTSPTLSAKHLDSGETLGFEELGGIDQEDRES